MWLWATVGMRKSVGFASSGQGSHLGVVIKVILRNSLQDSALSFFLHAVCRSAD